MPVKVIFLPSSGPPSVTRRPRTRDDKDNPVIACVGRCWRIDGSEQADNESAYVVETVYGLTIVDWEGHMLTTWRAEISPGDLARLHYRKG